MWYDKSELLSYNKMLNMAIGNRGNGKTYDAKKWCIKDFKKTGSEFIWVRRYKNEITQDMMSRFFADIGKEFPNDKLEVKGKRFYCNGECFGEIIPLSTSQFKKSVSFANVNKIIFDEFIIDKGAVHYLPHEVECFLDLIETIARMRDNVRVLMLANTISIINPYTLFFNIKINPNKRFTVTDNIAIELVADHEYIEEKKKTRYGKLVEGTKYGEYAIDGKFLRDNETFVEKKTPEADFVMAIKYNSTVYGFWVDYNIDRMFVNTQFDPYSQIYAITKDDHEPNLMLIKSLSTCKPMQRILYAFQHALIRFDNMQVKNQFYEFMHYFVK